MTDHEYNYRHEAICTAYFNGRTELEQMESALVNLDAERAGDLQDAADSPREGRELDAAMDAAGEVLEPWEKEEKP